MMAEELSVRDERKGYIVGRCIHLDSQSPEGTLLDQVRLDHIDLAINVYQDNAMRTRLEQKLDVDRKVVDASCRTHLLRVDGAQFPILFDCAPDFFQSSVLVLEWLDAQFKRTDCVTE